MQALRHGRHVELLIGPALLGETVLLADKNYFGIQPLTYRWVLQYCQCGLSNGLGQEPCVDGLGSHGHSWSSVLIQ